MPKACFRGVTGFDGLYLERRATQCTLDDTPNPRATKLAKNTLASAKKSPYFGKVGDIAFAYATARG
mgnify:CR=1 FL=1